MGSSLGTPLPPEEKASEQRYYGVPPSDERYMLLAAKDGDVPRLTKSLHFLHPCTVYDDYEDTPLHHAAVRGHVHACEAIFRRMQTIEYSYNPMDWRTGFGIVASDT